MGETCKTCSFFCAAEGSPVGECRVSAPAVLFREDRTMSRAWAVVFEADWCGRHPELRVPEPYPQLTEMHLVAMAMQGLATRESINGWVASPRVIADMAEEIAHQFTRDPNTVAASTQPADATGTVEEGFMKSASDAGAFLDGEAGRKEGNEE